MTDEELIEKGVVITHPGRFNLVKMAYLHSIDGVPNWIGFSQREKASVLSEALVGAFTWNTTTNLGIDESVWQEIRRNLFSDFGEVREEALQNFYRTFRRAFEIDAIDWNKKFEEMYNEDLI